MLTTNQIGAGRLAEILRNNNINSNQVCLVNWNLRQEVWDWCEQSNISISYLGSLYSIYDVWQILREDHIMWFRLKWE
jgi:hypothetical protein